LPTIDAMLAPPESLAPSQSNLQYTE